MRLFYKLNAGTLVLTIVIALILSILCSGIILLGYHNRFNQQQFNIAQALIRDEESTINIVLTDTTFTAAKEEKICLFPEDRDSVSIKKGAWGIFRYASVECTKKGSSRQSNFLYGSLLPEYMNACLYMADHQRPLALVGHTRLKGNTYLSRAGIKPAYMDQRGYNGEQLVDGSIRNSKETLPSLDSNILIYLHLLLREASDTGLHKGDINLMESQEHAQSFSAEAVRYHHQGKLSLAGVSLKGHIILFSDQEIEVGASARLENIILVAPVIRFKSNVKGSVQAIAGDSLVMEPGVALDYPSAAILLKSWSQPAQNVLRMAENCVIKGMVLSWAPEKDMYKSYIEIGQGSGVSGIVYTAGYLSLRGWVHGTVLTDYFIYKSPATIYENYLVDAVINRDKLSRYFTGSPVFSSSGPQKIMAWLN